MTPAEKAAYDKLCYDCPAWRARKLASNEAYRKSRAGKTKSTAYESARRASPERVAYMKAYRDRQNTRP